MMSQGYTQDKLYFENFERLQYTRLIINLLMNPMWQ